MQTLSTVIHSAPCSTRRDHSASAMTTSHKLRVPAKAQGSRLDKWIAETIPSLSRARVQSLIAAGSVSLAGRAVTDAARKVKAGEAWDRGGARPDAARPCAAQAMDLDVVYEDAALIVINKPAGLVVHPAAGNPDRTLVNALLAHCGDSLRGIGGVLRPGIVHRIDKDTSGLIVVAKTAGAHAALAAQFAAHDVERRYDALVWGVPKPARGTITGAIGRSPHNRQKMAIVRRGGKAAETDYETVARFGDAGGPGPMPPQDRAHASDPRPPVVTRPSADRRSGLWTRAKTAEKRAGGIGGGNRRVRASGAPRGDARLHASRERKSHPLRAPAAGRLRAPRRGSQNDRLRRRLPAQRGRRGHRRPPSRRDRAARLGCVGGVRRLDVLGLVNNFDVRPPGLHKLPLACA